MMAKKKIHEIFDQKVSPMLDVKITEADLIKLFNENPELSQEKGVLYWTPCKNG